MVITINDPNSTNITMLMVFPMPSYLNRDASSKLSLTRWLLSQAKGFQKLHILVNYKQIPPQLQPLFPTSTEFRDPIEMH